MILNNFLITIVFVLTLLISASFASQEKPTPEQLDKIDSLTELNNLLGKSISTVEGLTRRREREIQEFFVEMDFVERIANRIHYLSNYKGEEIKPLTQPLFQKIVALFDKVLQTAVKEMEALQLGTMDSEVAMESLFSSKRWKELEVTASMVNYRLNKAKYYWALVHPEDSAKKKNLLEEAIDGFSFPYNIVYQNPQLTLYSFLGRALCLRELGNLDESIKELNYIIHKGDQSFPRTLSSRARYELARAYLLAKNYHECLKEVNKLLSDTTGLRDEPNLTNNVKFLKIKASFMLITSGEDKLKPRQIEGIYSDALSTVTQLIKVSHYWQEQVFSVLTQDSVRDYLMQKDRHDPYIGWILGEGLFYENKFGKAIPFFKIALSGIDKAIHSGRRDMNFKLGVCYYNLKKFKEAIPYFATCIYKYPRVEITEKAAYLHYKAYENLYNERWNSPYIKAINFYLKNYPQHKFVSDAHYRLGKYYGQKGRVLAAIKEFEKVNQESRYFVRSRFFIFQYRTEDFERLRVKPGLNPKTSYRRAIRARKNFMTAMQGEDRDKLMGKDPERNNFMAHAALFSARLFIHGPEKKYSQAVKELNNFERRYPSRRGLFLPVRILRIEAFHKLADFKRAGKEVEKLIRDYTKHPKVNDILIVLADQFMEEKGKERFPAPGDGAIERSKIAILIYENLLRKSREKAQNEEIQYTLASLYLKVGNYQRAGAIYQEILKNQPNSIRSLKGLGEIYEREKKYKKALANWRILEENLRVGESGWYEAKYKIASIYEKLGNSPQACKILTVTRSLHPDLGGKASRDKFLQLEKKVCSDKAR